MEDKEKWLLSVIKYPRIEAACLALGAGANPNIIDPETTQTALQLTIRNNDLPLFKLLIEGIPGKTANINGVGYNFETCIDFTAKTALTNKFAFMKTLIEKRTSFSRDELHTYVTICSMHLSHVPLRQQDFAVMANYVSRMCGIHLGNLLNYDNNPDRYLVHLCQYDYAEKNRRELEGWHANKFLPIRIFSLFETLVKLKKGFLSINERKIVEYEDVLAKEILLELETFKLLQESEAIAAANGLTEGERAQLYDTLVGVFLTRLKNNPGKEFSLASGYRGHAFYISFVWTAKVFANTDEFLIRYKNLGLGVDKIDGSSRHIIKDNKVYPREIAVPISNELELRNYIKKLFEIKSQNIEGSDYREFTGSLREEKRKLYERSREEKLISIYDDTNKLAYRVLPLNTPGMNGQEAATCVAISHQLGLLICTKDESFYKWIVAEEKRTIVQVSRNESANLAHHDVFWQLENKTDFAKLFFYPGFCPEILDGVYKSYLSSIDYEIVRDINNFIPVNNDEFYALWMRLENKIQHLAVNNAEVSIFLMLLIAVLAMRKGALANHGIEKLKIFQYAHGLFNAGGITHLNTAYCLALSAFFIGDIARAKQVFSVCLGYVENYEKIDQESRRNYLESIGIGPKFGFNGDDYIYMRIMKTNILISLGFVNIALGNYEEAERVFECTGVKTNLVVSYYPEALLGLGIICDYKFRQSQNSSYAELALGYFINIGSESKASVYHIAKKMSQKLLDHFNALKENIKKRDHTKMENPATSASAMDQATALKKKPKKEEHSLAIADNPHILLAKLAEAAALSSETALQPASAATAPHL